MLSEATSTAEWYGGQYGGSSGRELRLLPTKVDEDDDVDDTDEARSALS
jgi:hypothetical protein